MDIVWHTKGPLRTPGGMTLLGEFDGMSTYVSRHGWCREVVTHYLSSLGISSELDGWVDILNTTRYRADVPRGNGHTTTWVRDVFSMYTNMVKVVLDSDLTHLDRHKFAGRWGVTFFPGSRIPRFKVLPIQIYDDPQVVPSIAWKMPPAYRRDNPHLFARGVPMRIRQNRGHLFGIPISWVMSIPIMSSLIYFPRLWKQMLVSGHSPSSTARHFRPRLDTTNTARLGNLWWRLLATLGATAQFSKQGRIGLWVLIGLYCLMLRTPEQRDQYISLLYQGRGRVDGMNSWARRLYNGQELPEPLHDLYAKLYEGNQGVGNLMRPVSYLY